MVAPIPVAPAVDIADTSAAPVFCAHIHTDSDIAVGCSRWFALVSHRLFLVFLENEIIVTISSMNLEIFVIDLHHIPRYLLAKLLKSSALIDWMAHINQLIPIKIDISDFI